MKLFLLFLSVCERILNRLVPVQPKHWVFGSDKGNMYREGSKYLIEYMLKNHPEYDCTFITHNTQVIKELKSKGIPVANNYSIKGLYKIAIADCVFTTQVLSDVKFVYKKKGRSFFYLIHGQPFKRALKMLSQDYWKKQAGNNVHNELLSKIKRFVSESGGYTYKDISFVSATSDFTASLLRREYEPSVGIKILGMPRNDALFDSERMKTENWDSSFDGKFVITYMPTHRQYGNGSVSQTPFLYRNDVQQWMREHGIVFLVKQHPNMLHKLSVLEETDVIKNISKAGYDPQVVIYHSDVLITDYSSVWMDYLLLHRPLIFYFYDSFEKDDAGCYYNLRDEFPHNWCDSENGLYEMIKRAYSNKDLMTPSEEEIRKFHYYVDNKSCERYFIEIERMMYGAE